MVKKLDKVEPRVQRSGLKIKTMDSLLLVSFQIKSLLIDSLVIDSSMTDSLMTDSLMTDSLKTDSSMMDSLLIYILMMGSLLIDSLLIDKPAKIFCRQRRSTVEQPRVQTHDVKLSNVLPLCTYLC
jgi:hypothetical protein